jgi:hypothetical protein
MATTAVINRRKRRRSAKRRSNPKRRRRHMRGAAASSHRRRRSSRRRRNPQATAAVVKAAYQPRNYRRQNPQTLAQDMNGLMEVLPAATGGVLAARWAVQQAGEFKANEKGVAEPGFSHALAIYLAARFGGQMIGSLLGDPHKGTIAAISALGFGGDMFLRLRFMRDNETFKKNFSLAGYDDDAYVDNQDEPYADMGAYQDAVGNTWVRTASGWQLSGYHDSATEPQRLAGFQSQSALGGFQNQSALGGGAVSNRRSSFGYARG